VQPPPQAAPPPPAVPNDQAIRNVLQAYADAYSRLDANAVRRVFPSANEQALRQAFSGMKSFQVQIQDAQINVSGSTATVTCTWASTFSGTVGGVQRASPKITLRLQKTGDSWVIVDRR
jgi:ketosteroid isomerase-like protein